MKPINEELYNHLQWLRSFCIDHRTCANCPLHVEEDDGDVYCIFQVARPCRIETRKHVSYGVHVIPFEEDDDDVE